ncbi:ATP-binding protein [Lysobacter humi (ex Lee et al. 2017)]
MRLAAFIRSDLERVLAEWDRFARQNAPADPLLTDLVLRDHAKEMLLAVADDIETAQTDAEQLRKSEGRGAEGVSRSAATVHGRLRHRHDFSLAQLGAEFRALRSTVLRLWLPHVETMSETTVHEVVRFNEAIDQALAESMAAYSDATAQAQQLLLAVLGHDLRAPLANVAMCGEMLARGELGGNPQVLAQTVQRSAKLMRGMVDDLLGYTSTQLGRGLPIEKAWCDLGEVLDAAVADARATHPATRYELHVTGVLSACHDPTRLHQLFVNLLVNAAQHGATAHPVMVEAAAGAAGSTVRITNYGSTIPDAALRSIFKPLVQLEADTPSDTRAHTSLGLGLYIAREIAEGHGGSVGVTSSDAHGTTFTVELPRDLSCRAGDGSPHADARAPAT